MEPSFGLLMVRMLMFLLFTLKQIFQGTKLDTYYYSHKNLFVNYINKLFFPFNLRIIHIYYLASHSMVLQHLL